MSKDWGKYVEVAKLAVEAGAAVLEAHMLSGYELKPDGSPVTEADKLAEQAIRGVILPAFPECGFIGEEFPAVNAKASLIWYCDPIDGTWSYLNKEHTSCLSLGLFENGKPRVSIIYNPFTKESYYGIEGKTPIVNHIELPRKQVSALEDAVVNFHVTPIYSYFVKQLYDWWQEEKFAKLISRGGSIAYAFAKVAEGVHHVCISKGKKDSKIWDLGTGIHLIEQCGGIVTNLNGKRAYEYSKGDTIIACISKELHQEVIELLKS